ncbi:hypothetical protein B0T21DRAFT_320935, partial [Apiosordaria backusii]
MSEKRKRKPTSIETSLTSSKKPTKTPKPTPPSKPSSTPISSSNNTSNGPLPKNWPPSFPYLTAPSYSHQLTPSQLSALKVPDPSLPEIRSTHTPGPATHVQITPITDPKHPAYGQCGLFATQHLPPGSLILPYLGEYHPGTNPSPSNPIPSPDGYDYSQSDYDLWLSRDADIAVDAARLGNEARYVNDYRGVPYPPPPPPLPGQKLPKQIKGKPNAEFKVAWDVKRQERVMSVWVLPAGKKGLFRGVRKGEEVLVSYGRGFWEGRRGKEEEE